jgi:hypothetical protein
MNDAQTIFAVFYAIFWGAVFSVSSRWKPFNFGLIFDKEVQHVTKRILLAKLILNILPILYFVIIFYVLELKGKLCELQRKCLVDITAIVLSGIIPAFAIFGFYRLWIGIIERRPKSFYDYSCNLPTRYTPCCCAKTKPEPGLEELGIIPSNYYAYRKNIIVGIAYVLVAISGAVIPFPTLGLLTIILLLLLFWSLIDDNLIIIIPPIIMVVIFIIFLISIYWMIRYIFNPYVV